MPSLIQSYNTSVNEPIFNPLIVDSFVFIPSAGMRLAPELLLIELYREVFYKERYGSAYNSEFKLDESDSALYNEREIIVLSILMGRRKKTNNTKNTANFYAPAYPELARNVWFGKKRERVVNSFYLCGPLAQYFSNHRDVSVLDDFVKKYVRALLGNNSMNSDSEVAELLSLILNQDKDKEDELQESGEQILAEKLKGKNRAIDNFGDDVLSNQIYHDTLALMALEKDLPRMQWIQVYMTFLRFILPIWLMSQMNITKIIHHELFAIFSEKKSHNFEEIDKQFHARNENLLHPSITPTREIFEITEQYMKNRIELNIMLYLLTALNPEELSPDKSLTYNKNGSGCIPLSKLFDIAQNSVNRIDEVKWFSSDTELDFEKKLIRKAEAHSGWVNPLQKGQGKNIDEFFRVLYQDLEGDEQGGSLLEPNNMRASARGFRVFPGQLLLKTIVFLASREKRENGLVQGGGLLVLEDVENHFQKYGIDFGYATEARPELLNNLSALGLLKGSPDAGSSAAVVCPF